MPWGRVLTFTDPFSYQSVMLGIDAKIYPTGRGKFHSELTQVGLNQVWTQHYHEKLPRIFASSMKLDRRVIGFLTDENQPAIRYCSLDVSPRDVIVRGGDEVYQHSEAGCRYATMSLATADLGFAYKTLVGRELVSPRSTYLMRPDHKLMSRLLKLQKIAEHIAKTNPGLFDFPEVVRNLEHQLIHVMVRCLAESAFTQMSAGASRHGAIVSRFEEFLEANPDRPIYLTEICGAIGVSERILRTACGSIWDWVRSAISTCEECILSAERFCARITTATVARVATDHGFWELGRLSVAYRALFGECRPKRTSPRHDQLVSLNRPSSLEFASLHHGS